MVDRTLNEWSEWQLKNLNAIVWLYRGEVDKYKALIDEYLDALLDYHTTLDGDDEIVPAILTTGGFSAKYAAMKAEAQNQRAKAKAAVDAAAKKEKKAVSAQWDERITALEAITTVMGEAAWLTEKFGNNGEYHDIPGLCKMASRVEIAEKNYSLTPGAYVGVAAVEDDGVDFAQRMGEIYSELLSLHAESNELMQTISKNMKEMGL